MDTWDLKNAKLRAFLQTGSRFAGASLAGGAANEGKERNRWPSNKPRLNTLLSNTKQTSAP
jgi:hypothetical protein